MTALVIQTSFLGDVVLTTPLIAHLAQAGAVDVVTTPAAAPLLANNPSVRRVVIYDKRGTDRGMRALRRVSHAVRVAGAESIAYCAQGSVRSALLARLAGFRDRVGFDTSAGRWLYTRRISYRADQHHAERLLRLAVGNDVSVAPEAITPSLFPSAEDLLAVDSLLASYDATGERLIALAPGSIWATKRWPAFPALARTLSSHGRIVVTGGADDRDLAAAIQDTCSTAIDATGRLPLLASADLIRRSALLVTNDSLPQHLASAMGTPTITIFGPTVPGFGFGPLARGSVAVGHASLPCRPCHPHGPPACPLGHHLCMRDLPPPAVLAPALTVLGA